MRPILLLAGAAGTLAAALVVSHLALAEIGIIATLQDVRLGLQDRLETLALERARRTAGFHNAANRALLEGTSLHESAAREVSDGANALVRRAEALESFLDRHGAAGLPADERSQTRVVLDDVHAAVQAIADAAERLALDPEDPEPLQEADTAARRLDDALEGAQSLIDGHVRRAGARQDSLLVRARRTSAVLGVIALVLAVAAGAGCLRRRMA